MPSFTTGVYAIINTTNNKMYVGSSSTSLKKRWNVHKTYLRQGIHHNRHLQNAWNKYGEAAFIFKILQYCTPDKCIEREQYWIDHYQVCNRDYGYNKNPLASSGKGRKVSEESRVRIAEAAKKRSAKPEWRAKRSAIMKGTKASDSAKAKMSASRKGKKWSNKRKEEFVIRMNDPDIKANMSAAQKARPPRPPMSEEQKKKLAIASTGKKQSPETIAKKIASMTGKKRSEETKAKMKAARLAFVKLTQVYKKANQVKARRQKPELE